MAGELQRRRRRVRVETPVTDGMERQGLRRTFQVGVLWSVLQRWGQSALGFIVFVILARLLTPEAFGLVAMAMVVIAFFRVFVDQGFEVAVVQRKTDPDPAYLDTAFWFNIGIGVLFMAVGMLGSGLVARVYGEAQLEAIIQVLSLGFVFVALTSVQQGLLRRRLMFKQLTLRSLIGDACGGIVGIGMAVAGFGVWSLVGQTLTTSFMAPILLWSLSDWRPGLRFSMRALRDLLHFSTPVLGTNLITVFSRHSDRALVGYFLGSELLGFYYFGRRFISVVSGMFSGVITRVGLPIFSKMQDDVKRARHNLYEVVKYSSIISFPIFLGVALLAPDAIPVIFGAKWIPSVEVVQFLAFLGILQSLVSWSGTVTLALGRPMWRLMAAAVTGVARVVVVATLASWGIVVVAAGVVGTGVLTMALQYVIMRKLVGIEVPELLRQLRVPAVASAVMAVVVWSGTTLLPGAEPYQRIIFGIGLGALTYGGVVAALEPSLVVRLWRARSPVL